MGTICWGECSCRNPFPCGNRPQGGLRPAAAGNKVDSERGSDRSGRLRHGGGAAPLLETFTAINGPSHPRLERDGRLLPALRAHGRGLNVIAADLASISAALRFAALATARRMLKPLSGKKNLLADGEYEVLAALDTLQHPVVLVHRAHPPASKLLPACGNVQIS